MSIKTDLVIKFNGQVLTEDMGLVESPDYSILPSVQNTLEKIGNSNGEKLIDSSLSSHVFPFVFMMYANDIKEAKDRLTKLLYTKKEARLEISTFPDRYWMAKLDGSSSFVRSTDNIHLFKLTISFLIPDGIAYSTASRAFSAIQNEDGLMEMEVINDGNFEVPINYNVKHNHENGYIGVVSEHGTAQIGNLQELDTKVIQASDWVIRDDNFRQFEDYWSNNEGYLTENFPKTGTWKDVQIEQRQYIMPNSFGPVEPTWRFATKYRQFSADRNGRIGSENFTAQVRLYFMNTHKTGIKEAGIMSCLIASSEGTRKIGFIIHKYSPRNNRFKIKLYYNGYNTNNEDEVWDMDMHRDVQKATTWETGLFEVKKMGDKISFTFAGNTYTRVVPALRDVVFENVTLGCGAHETTPGLQYMGWDYIFLQVHGVDVVTNTDIQNSFIENSEVIIDNENSKYYYNPTSESNSQPISISDVVGSNWFKVPPGKTLIQFYYSDFSDPPPTITGEIREVY